MRKIGVIFTIAALLACSASFAVAVTVTGVTSDHANGTFGLGEVVHVQVTFSESVTYTAGSGGFGIQLETGVSDRTAAYLSGSPGAVLTFTYTVQSTDSTADLDYKATNSLALTDNAALVDTATGLVNATLTLATPGAANSLGANKALVIDGIVPTCTINQAVAQVDPTYGTTINFTVVTSESTSNFATGDVTLTGTAGATTGTVTGSGTTYNVAVTGMTGDGTVIASIAINKFTDAAGNQNATSTSTDHTVTFDTTAPTVTVEQATTQEDPTTATPINFTAIFSEAVTGFATGDVTLTGTAGATTGTVTGSGAVYNIAVTGMNAAGTVIAAIAGTKCIDAAGNANEASSSTDHTVTYSFPVATETSAAGAVKPISCGNGWTYVVWNFTGSTAGLASVRTQFPVFGYPVRAFLAPSGTAWSGTCTATVRQICPLGDGTELVQTDVSGGLIANTTGLPGSYVLGSLSATVANENASNLPQPVGSELQLNIVGSVTSGGVGASGRLVILFGPGAP